MDRKSATRILTTLCLASVALWSVTAQELALPSAPNSLKFAVIGDSGSGDSEQYAVANQMARFRGIFPFDMVIMLGDNIYGGQGATDLAKKFAQPYKALLDGGVKFYATLGNHDDPVNRQYPLWNMGGQLYYTYAKKNVRFFALDSNYMDPEQIAWLKKELSGSDAPWKICYFHHPLYSDSKAHGSDTDLRKVLEPIFKQYGVRVVFSGHEHTYERLKPQQGIFYFVLGNSGQLRFHNLRKKSTDTEKGFDTDRGFGLVEVAGGEFFFLWLRKRHCIRRVLRVVVPVLPRL